ncbi:hypothetical protein [Actomonas aquatica]|uniref:DUF4390 domain-containing protein n=1 Tax=Actomonas aquatica TaxID=2866162 RepID=A0ABZ1CCB1_9BACT|nr:hypothetical protein [Opitutus sp. WL0086]WRQ89211.1 hypothetical protein K1X11_007310 [Opitutus sp. WL0086]
MRFTAKLLLLVLVTCTPGWASEPVTVTATSAIRVAWVERGAKSEEVTELQRTFAPVFRVALEGIYGDHTEVVFEVMSSSRAAQRLERREVDAVLQFATKLSRRLQADEHHVLRAESVAEPGRYVAFLVLPEAQSTLQDLLANAFSASINHYEVRASLHDELPLFELAAGW